MSEVTRKCHVCVNFFFAQSSLLKPCIDLSMKECQKRVSCLGELLTRGSVRSLNDQRWLIEVKGKFYESFEEASSDAAFADEIPKAASS